MMATDELGDNGLPIADVGEWVENKLAAIREYVTITAPARRNYLRRGNAGVTYIELFCGPGQARVRGTNDVYDGSAIVAAQAARDSGVPFTDVYLADTNKDYVDACVHRVGGSARRFSCVGPASETSESILGKLNPHALHFVVLDPFNLDDLPFDVIKNLARLRHVDMLIHFSSQDLQRNLDLNLAGDRDNLDGFCPGWRLSVPVRASKNAQRRAYADHWCSLMSNLGMTTANAVEHVVGTKNQTLYWLYFAAKNPLAIKLWNAMSAARGPQRQLFV